MWTKAKQLTCIWKNSELSQELVLIKIWLQKYIFPYLFSYFLKNFKSLWVSSDCWKKTENVIRVHAAGSKPRKRMKQIL